MVAEKIETLIKRDIAFKYAYLLPLPLKGERVGEDKGNEYSNNWIWWGCMVACRTYQYYSFNLLKRFWEKEAEENKDSTLKIVKVGAK